MFATVTQLLMKQGRVEIDGFGTFELHQRKARRGRNPRTGELIILPAKVTVRFKPAAALKRSAANLSGVPDGA
jgi:nucleoid DNA-binding protein